jgi:hypothetical protein
MKILEQGADHAKLEFRKDEDIGFRSFRMAFVRRETPPRQAKTGLPPRQAKTAPVRGPGLGEGPDCARRSFFFRATGRHGAGPFS